MEKLDLGDFHVHFSRQHKSSIEGVKFEVHAHDHGAGHHHHHEPAGASHGHGHAHDHEGHAHGEEHRHEHASDPNHDHGHGEEHEHEFDYEAEEEHAHGRTFSQIRALIHASTLSPWVKEKSVAVFERIARAEGKIHGKPADQVHFHEVGAVDSIVDIVGGCVCLELLGRPRVLAAPVIEGTGWINCAHGRFPIPAPATIAILAERGAPLSQCEERHELVTPTGAAFLAEFVAEFGPMPPLIPEKIGYGLGERNNKTRPNVLRAILATSANPQADHDWESDQIAILETNLDDINPEILGYVVEKALAQGALDVFHTPIQMKKNRPGVLLTILCTAGRADEFTELFLRETTALGVRRTSAERKKLKRAIIKVPTPFGEVEIKTGSLDGQTIQASPEFESCKQIALDRGVPIKSVFQAAVAASARL
ncbi:MAG TPA: nickel pincer cofactor biosynthesis protein LarC [Verrucomicrobiae bacterium]|nr:nickel pincer cofactor biosynthesis protein LarC [Verrucomicrobiae bacterium]